MKRSFAMFKTKNDLPQDVRSKSVALLNTLDRAQTETAAIRH